MSDLVTQVQRMAQTLVSNEIRAGESAEGAMKRVARACGVSYFTLWQLRYRAPKRIFADVYLAILAAHEATVARERQKLEHQLRIAEARGVDTDLARSIGGLSRVDRP